MIMQFVYEVKTFVHRLYEYTCNDRDWNQCLKNVSKGNNHMVGLYKKIVILID